MERGSTESALGNFLVDVMFIKAKQHFEMPIDAAIINQGGVRSRIISKGPITLGALFELMPFDNLIVVQQLKGSTLQQLLDHIAGQGGWPLAGITMQIKNKKAINVKVNGKPLVDTAIYAVANSNYTAEGGDDAEMLKAIPYLSKGLLIRDVLIDYVREQSKRGIKISAKKENRVVHVE
jgi:2',3'-cyclic-nucleotide 2'-phosphodiesterase (5'-nucleotidase family)